MSLKTIIGLEIHVELQTDTKMFCGCKNEYGCPPNTNVCPTCLGHPGTLPRINKRAIEYAIMAGNAFNCEISMDMKMDRKKYFYPDLVKGYQITQERTPICKNGYIEIETENGVKKVRLQRIHIEEDTGKSIHNESGHTLMDYNRAGVPLIEIVSEPDMNSPLEAIAFLTNLKETIKYLGISDVKMEEGSLRCDVNLNVVDEETGFKTKITEIKNLNSFKAALRAMEHEQKRHIENVKNNIIGEKETRRWDEAKLETIIMRHKEEGNDYRFSVEPDIPYITLEESFVESIKEKMPELPRNKKNRFLAEYKLSEYDANVLTQNKYLSEYFEKVVKKVDDATLVSNWLLSDVLRRVKDLEIEFEEIPLNIESFASLLKLVKENKINGKIKLVFSNRKNAYGLIRAQNESIDTFYLNRKKFFCNEEYDERILEELERRNIDLIVLAGYLNILSSKFVSKYSNRIINIHPSLIPSFCGDGFYGENVHKAVIKSGVKFTGATTHFVDEKVDTGAIILQDVVPVYINDDFETVAKRVLEIEHEILVKTVKAFCDNKIVFKDNRAFIVEE